MKKNILLLALLLALTNGVLAQTTDDSTSIVSTTDPVTTTAIDPTLTLEFFKKCFFQQAIGDCAVADLNSDGVINAADLALYKSSLETTILPATDTQVLLPPEKIEIKYLEDSQTVGIRWMSLLDSFANTYDYVLFRSCNGGGWIALSEITANFDSAYTYTTFDPAPIDGCEYAIAARNSGGDFSRLSKSIFLKIPVVSTTVVDSSVDTTINTIATPTDAPVEIQVEPMPTPVIDEVRSLEEQKILLNEKRMTEALLQKPQTVKGVYLIDAQMVGTTLAEGSQMEIYIKKDNSSYEEYAGRFLYNREQSRFEFLFDTRKHPNGDYILIPRAVMDDGTIITGLLRHVRIENVVIETASTPEPYKQELIEHVQAVSTDVAVVDTSLEERRTAIKEKYRNLFLQNWNARDFSTQNREILKSCFLKPATGECSTSDLNSDGVINTADLALFKTQLQKEAEKDADRTFERNIDEMTALSVEGNREALLQKRKDIAEKFGISLSDDTLNERSLSSTVDRDQRRESVQNRIDDIEAIARERKELLNDRVQADVFRDADSDGISNFDEINIYKTDPFTFDSDSDGVGDGAEIENGFNPLDKKLEAVIKYQEAREAGMVNADIFAVRSVKAVIQNREVLVSTTEKSQRPASNSIESTRGPIDSSAIEKETETKIETTVGLEFEGVAPPNSFVTLYIYSTPIIVTVKTDSDGNWSYIFDKELEDGEHEVYVAMTDNMGQVYMRSNPLNFVKEAQAVTYDQPIVSGTVDQPSLLNQKYLLMTVLSIMAIIGIFFMIIGVRSKQRIDG